MTIRVLRNDALDEICLSWNDSREEDLLPDGLVIPDCSQDQRFRNHALIAAREGGVRFYTGLPLMSSTGRQLGAIAVADRSPRECLKENKFRNLREHVTCVVRHLELVGANTQRYSGDSQGKEAAFLSNLGVPSTVSWELLSFSTRQR